jgi:tRNA U34 2-thiouridine synthase MnmA/TrmU
MLFKIGMRIYTVGQRQGIGIVAETRYYVVKMYFATHTLFIGQEADLYDTKFVVGELNLFPID